MIQSRPLMIAAVVSALSGLGGRTPAAPADPTPPRERPPTTRPAGAARRAPDWVPARPGPWHRTLRVARSEDGLRFRPDPRPVIRFADAPALVPLEDGRLLLVFEYYSRRERRDFGVLGHAVSTDGGRTWSAPQALPVRGLRRRHGRPRGPALSKRTDGAVELFFGCEDRRGRQVLLAARRVAGAKGGKRSGAKADAETGHGTAGEKPAPNDRGKKTGPHAVDREAIGFALRGRLRPEDKDLRLDDLVLLDMGGLYHLYATPRSDPTRRFHGTLFGSRRIHTEAPLPAATLGRAGTVVRVGGLFRFYAGARGAILSAASVDGYGWTREPGPRLAAAGDPAVARLADGTYVMVYVEASRAEVDDTRLATEGGPGQPAATHDEWTDAEWAALGADAEGPDADDPLADLLAGGDEAGPSDVTDGPGGDEGTGERVAGTATAGLEATAEDAEAAYEPEYCIGHVPVPDFIHRVDYRAWFEQRYDADAPLRNAFDAYDAFMPHPCDAPGEGPAWPVMAGMFNDAGFVGAPGPWDPAAHPAWESAYSAAADLLGRYAEAASIEAYVPRITFSRESQEDALYGEDGRDLLINILLPQLSSHRTLARQMLSDAWRAPEGRPDPRAMLAAIDATLSSAGHVGDGDFLIERLVGGSIRHLAETNARWALKHEVFSADEMEAALEILIEKDRPLPPASDWIAGEMAASLDMTQFVYGPIEPGRPPRLNPERLALISSFTADDARQPAPSPEQIAAADPRKTTETFIEYYEAFTELADRGHPEVTAEDLDRLTQDTLEEDIVVSHFLPALSRVYQVFTRQEAGRRATQLTYAIHLHHARTGRWPASLDDLPRRTTETARIDPFTKRDFVYRLTDDGPLLYSASENGADDGGRHHRRWGDRRKNAGDDAGDDAEGDAGDDAEDEGGDDYVFWPPQRR